MSRVKDVHDKSMVMCIKSIRNWVSIHDKMEGQPCRPSSAQFDLSGEMMTCSTFRKLHKIPNHIPTAEFISKHNIPAIHVTFHVAACSRNTNTSKPTKNSRSRSLGGSLEEAVRLAAEDEKGEAHG